MANQIVVSAGAKVRNLQDVIIGTSGVLTSLGFDVANGVPRLDVNGKILVSQLPNSVMEYLGTWNAATNTPTLVNGTGNQGDVYLCNVAGTVDFGAGPIVFFVGDQVIYSGSIWQRASGATGTVTSVAITESGDSLNITGSPITTSGTINIGFNGTNLQYVNGAGNLTTFPTLTGYVPYSGATANVNLGEYGLSGGFIGFDTTPTSTPTAQGTMYWSADKESVDVIMNGVTGSVMQDTFYNVKNQTGATITKGTIVRANGTVGASGRILIAPFLADGSYDSKVCLGVTSETILNGEDGKVTAFGAIRQIDTSAFANGTILYASPTTAGGFTSTEPTNPSNIVTIAIVVYSDVNNGEIFVRPTFVDNAADIAASLGYIPQAQLNGTGFVKAIGTTITYDNSTYALDSAVVHNTGNETIGGTKTFSNATKNNGGILLQNGSTSSTTGYMNLGGTLNGFRFTNDLGITNSFTLPSATGYFFTFPSATGTLALTSDISYPVTSVFGRTGAVVATSGDYTTAQVTESGNLYFTDSRARLALSAGTGISYNNTTGVITNSAPDQTVSLTAGAGISVSGSYPSFTIASTITQYTDALARAALSFVAGSGAYNSTTGVITIPTNNNQIANGAGYITSSALSGYLPLTGGTLTGALNINLSSGTAMNVAGNAIFRGDTGVGTPRQLIITSGGSTPVYLEAKGYGANYQTDFGIKTFNSVGTAFEVFYADSSGRVGINQVSPSYQLDVNGTGRFSSSVTATNLILNGTATTALDLTSGTFSYALDFQNNDFIRQKNVAGTLGLVFGMSTDDNLYVRGYSGINLQVNNGTTALGLASTGAATFSGAITQTNALSTGITVERSTGGNKYIEWKNTLGSFYAGITSANNFNIGTNPDIASSSQFVLTSGGNVGIGTSSPNIGGYGANGRILTIQGVSGSYGVLELTSNSANADGNAIGRLDFGSDGQAANYKAISSIASFLTGSTSTKFGADLRFYTRVDNAGSGDPSERMRITSTGNVGIGTASPRYILDARSANGAFNNGNIQAYFGTTSTSQVVGEGGAIGLGTWLTALGGQYQRAIIKGIAETTGNEGALLFGTMAADSSMLERMRITSGGTVLVNATTSSYGAALGYSFGVRGTNSQTLISIALANQTLDTQGAYIGLDGSVGYINMVDNKPWTFATNNAERMRITSDGNLLLGTTDNGSGAKLVFYSTTAAQQLKAAGTAPAITFSNTITSPTIGGSLGACTSANQFLSGTAAGDMILINQFTGNKLYITNYSGGVYLTQGATSWTANSDIRLKNINSHIENAVEKLSTLQTINFSYKDDKTNKQNLGLIAQEVEKIFPELIDKNGDGMLGVRYTELVPVLIKAVQELKLEIETLKNK